MSLQTIGKFFLFGRYARRAKEIWFRYSVQKKLKRLGVRAATSVRFYGMPIISLASESTIEIGENSVICSDPEMTALGVNHPVVLRTLAQGAVIVIGNNTGISGGSICAAIRVEIGNECLLGANVTITDTDFHPIKPLGRRHNNNPHEIGSEPVVIEDNVFIGAGVVILKGVRVGRNSVIGAGSVVTKNVPANTIVAGNPARILKGL
jgi:acetyltransferase-like isoleucine patch superfamily enzyme